MCSRRRLALVAVVILLVVDTGLHLLFTAFFPAYASPSFLLGYSFLCAVLGAAVLYPIIFAPLLKNLYDAYLADAVLRHVADGIIAFDRSGNITSLNVAAARMFRVRNVERTQKTMEFLFPDDWRRMQQCLCEGGACEGKVIEATPHRDGMPFPAEISVSSFVVGNVTSCIAVIRDLSERNKASRDLLSTNLNFKAIVDASPVGIISFDKNGLIDIWNSAAEKILGWGTDEVVGKPYPAVPHDKREEHREMRRMVLAGTGFTDWEVSRVRKDGSPVDLSISTAPIYDGDGSVTGIMSIVADITMRRKSEADLKLFQRAIESSRNGIFLVDMTAGDMPITYVNPSFERITGYSGDEVVGKNARFLHGRDAVQLELEKLRDAIALGQEGTFVIRNYRKDGTLFMNELGISPVRSAEGKITHYVGVMNDVTDRKRIEAELIFLANHDPLTGLPNRTLFEDRLAQALAHAERYQEQVAVIFLDLDHFKMVNDTLGHKFGDLLLKIAADRIRNCIRKGDTVARPGGDEFCLILPHINTAQDVIVIAEKILTLFAAPFSLDEREIYTSISLGITLFPGDGTTMEQLQKNADTAVFHAKEQGRKNYQFYSSDMNIRVMERVALEGSLRHALRKDEFVLHYQPRVDLLNGEIIGMEVLLRWNHPEQGLIYPNRFIGLAEDTGLIIPIGEWVLRTACRQVVTWLEAGLPPIRVAVNLSALQFRQQNLVDMVAQVLSETGLDPELLELEITESIAMQNAEQAIRTFNRLKEMGLHLAIDDFGTGYSSLNYLKRFPIDMLKIDQSFVREVSQDPDDAAIVRTIITMAHTLGLRVIAEGVETIDQLRFLVAHDCEEMQGYLFSRPLTPSAFEELVRSGRTLSLGGQLRAVTSALQAGSSES